MNYYGETLYHHGVKGQKWGLRRFQNEDGTLTEAGKKRYLQEARRDMQSEYKRNLSNPEARKVFRINDNGTFGAGMDAGEAYRKGKITSEDYAEAKRAAKRAHEYAKNKYGEKAMEELAKTGSFTITKKGLKFYQPSDFEPKAIKKGESLTSLLVKNKLNDAYLDSITTAKDRNNEGPWSEKPSKRPKGGRI